MAIEGSRVALADLGASGPSNREEWPWIAARYTLVRLIAHLHAADMMVLQQSPIAPLLGDRVKGLSWEDLLQAAWEATAATGREIANARTADQVQGARLRQESYEQAFRNMERALLAVAHRMLKKRPDLGGEMVAYGRRSVGAELEVITAREWEAGTPDWDNWRVVISGVSTFHGVRILYLPGVTNSIRRVVRQDIKARTIATSCSETGAPGRPSNMHLVRAEYARRRDAGIGEPKLNREAAELEAWFQKTHPDKQRPTAKTIANNIREQHRRDVVQSQPKATKL